MSLPVMASVLEIVRQNPHSAASLILYALVNTLANEKAGCLFKLNKLRDLDEPERQLAYDLIELMVQQQNTTENFLQIKQQMDQLIRPA